MIMTESDLQNKVGSMNQTYEELETIVSQLESTLATLNNGHTESAKDSLAIVIKNVKSLLDCDSAPMQPLPEIQSKRSH